MIEGKLPPQDTELEKAVLGSILMDGGIQDDLIGLLKMDFFYKEEHRLIYEGILKLSNSNQPIDILTITSELRRLGTLEAVGGAYYITDLSSRIGTTNNAINYCGILRGMAMKRNIIEVSNRLMMAAYESGSNPDKLIDEYDTKLLEIGESVSSDTPTVLFTDLASEAFAIIGRNMVEGNTMTGIPTGFSKLDKITGGMKGGQKITIAGRPSSGKSSLAVRIALNTVKWFNSRKENKAVVIFSLEVSKMEVAFKVISMEAKIETAFMDRGEITEEESQKVYSTLNNISGDLLYINDGFHVNAASMRRELKKVAKRHDGIGLVVVDYLQLMESVEYSGNREQEISKISRSLKGLAKEFEVPIIDLSQLNRGCESRPDKKPKLSDLRESGSIEQDADIAILVFRPEMYFDTDEAGESTHGKAVLIVAKNKNGQTGEIDVLFENKYTNFTENYSHSFAPRDIPNPNAKIEPNKKWEDDVF